MGRTTRCGGGAAAAGGGLWRTARQPRPASCSPAGPSAAPPASRLKCTGTAAPFASPRRAWTRPVVRASPEDVVFWPRRAPCVLLVGGTGPQPTPCGRAAWPTQVWLARTPVNARGLGWRRVSQPKKSPRQHDLDERVPAARWRSRAARRGGGTSVAEARPPALNRPPALCSRPTRPSASLASPTASRSGVQHATLVHGVRGARDVVRPAPLCRRARRRLHSGLPAPPRRTARSAVVRASAAVDIDGWCAHRSPATACTPRSPLTV